MRNKFRTRLHEVIFEADTPEGKAFDIVLLFAIISSVLIVILESVGTIQARYSDFFYYAEWSFTILFTIEYLLRLYSLEKPMKYATSFFGIVDILAVLPTYLSFFIAGTQYLLVIRALRLIRVFRIFKLGYFLKEAYFLEEALKASRGKIFVFLLFVLLMVTVIGSVMYVVEGGVNEGFSSIPKSIYWSIVTLTTVGFGDITPKTDFGQFLSSIVMMLGYAVIAVPTGIVSSAMIFRKKVPLNTQSCHSCGKEGHDDDANFCKNCGAALTQ